jgi:hypothetical protein
MKVSGFTIIRNAVKFDFPIVEAIKSILPVCDEVVVAIGKSDDDTLGLINGINDQKIRIIETVWDESLREGGRVLADETNKAFNAIAKDSDWAFYIQGDECVNEKYHPAIREAMLKWKDDERVEGLLFNYLHFYGSFDYVGASRKWYPKEVRIVRNKKGIHSFRDAQGFRNENKLLKVKLIDAWMYHYGWVKHPKTQQAKREEFEKLWHDDEAVLKKVGISEEFDYSQIDTLARFEGTHPNVMQERIDRQNWEFTYDPTKGVKLSLPKRVLDSLERITGREIGRYANYKRI